MLQFLIISISFIFISCSTLVASKPNTEHGIIIKLKNSKKYAERLNQDSIKRGLQLYTNHCVSCHGKTGKGDGPDALQRIPKPANLKKLVNEIDDFSFFMNISVWQGSMPGWKERFSPLEREDLVAYIKTFRGK